MKRILSFFCSVCICSALARAGATYIWTAVVPAAYATPGNWSPSRSAPAPTDILQFSAGGSVTVTGVPTQTIAGLQLSGNSTVNLQSAAAATLSINGGTGL